MTIRENLDLIDDILDTALSVPLSRGKSIVDIEKIREALDNDTFDAFRAEYSEKLSRKI